MNMKSLFISFALIVSSLGFCQLESKLDTNLLRIGEQTQFRIRWDGFQMGDSIQWPILEDTLHASVEIIDYQVVDTLDDGALEMSLTITSWDTGYHVIRPIPVRVNGETFTTEAALLGVQTVEVDTSAAPLDIKPIQEEPFSIKDWIRVYWPFLAGLLAIIGIVWFLLKARRKTGVEHPEMAAKPEIPIHVRCLEALESMARDAEWDERDAKEYYSRLTDVLRDYLEGRYRIPAHEQTSREILDALRYRGLSPSAQDELKGLMLTADMSKFAKERPGQEARVRHLQDAIGFIKGTLVTEPSNPETSDD